MPCIIRFFGDLPRAPLDLGTPMGYPVEVLIQNVNGVLILHLFSVLKTEKIDTQPALYH